MSRPIAEVTQTSENGSIADAAGHRTGENMIEVPRSVRIGGITKTELLAELQWNGVRLNEIARVLFANPDFATSELRTVLVTVDVAVGELGHTQGATIAQIFASAAECGLSVCPLELAPYLRLQFKDQPEGYWGHPPSEHRAPPGSLTIASRLVAAEDGASMGFYLRRIGGRALASRIPFAGGTRLECR